MVNVEDNFNIEDDTDWLLEEARPYYFFICLVLFLSQCYLMAFFYAVFAVSLIWEDDDEERTEFEYLDPSDGGSSYYEKFGFLVVWETLVEYLETISLDPSMSNDIPILNEFFIDLDNFFNSNNIDLNDNLFLVDIENMPKLDWSFFKTQSTKFDDQVNELKHIREEQYRKLNTNSMMIKLKFLSTKNIKEKKKWKAKFKKLQQMQDSLQEDLRQYQITAEVHNVFLVGYYLNNGLYPISFYDCERALLNGSYIFNFDEYFLFEYKYLYIFDEDISDKFIFNWVDDYLYYLKGSLII